MGVCSFLNVCVCVGGACVCLDIYVSECVFWFLCVGVYVSESGCVALWVCGCVGGG